MQTLYTSGTVFHAFLGEKLPSWKAAANLVRKIAENYKLPYYTLSPTYSVCKTHGYITGEHFTCPECGGATEVYSRITGYYRPVQNWNDGKAQEYKERKVYDIENSKLDKKEPCSCSATTDSNAVSTVADGNYLFTTATCPNCKMAVTILDKNNVAYSKLLAEENQELVAQFEIKQAPTLVTVKDGKAAKFVGVSDIKKALKV